MGMDFRVAASSGSSVTSTAAGRIWTDSIIQSQRRITNVVSRFQSPTPYYYFILLSFMYRRRKREREKKDEEEGRRASPRILFRPEAEFSSPALNFYLRY